MALSKLSGENAVAMAFSKLSGDEQGVILGQLRNALAPHHSLYYSSTCKELRALLPPAALQQLRTDYEAAMALCAKMGIWNCKELRQARTIEWREGRLSAANLATLATLGSVLPFLERLILEEHATGPDGVQPLAEGLIAGALPALIDFEISDTLVGDAGAAAIAAALDRGALPQLRSLTLATAAIGDAGLVALAPALRRRPGLEYLCLGGNPLGDEGLAALLGAPPPAGTPPPRPAGALENLEVLDLEDSQITDAGYATLAVALYRGALPALEELALDGSPAFGVVKAIVYQALAWSRASST